MSESNEVLEVAVTRAAIYLLNKTEEEREKRKGLSGFDISLAMEIMFGIPKETCGKLIIEEQAKIRNMEESREVIEESSH